MISQGNAEFNKLRKYYARSTWREWDKISCHCSSSVCQNQLVTYSILIL